MSRKVIITLAAAATVAVASLASTTSYARGFGGLHGAGGGAAFARGGGLRLARNARGGAGRIHPILPVTPRRPGRPGIPIIVGEHHHHHHHMHWVFRGGHWLEIDDVIEESPVVAAPVSVPGPCTCLTKTYTATGLVVFADVCTKESASAPAADDLSDASQAPTSPVPAKATPISQVPTTPNYAGRTYQEYLASNPQTMQPQASVQAPQATPSGPRQN
ncbi:MAG: hypothetical protein ACRECV_00410 [Xanthobacteraceae bacterium]